MEQVVDPVVVDDTVGIVEPALSRGEVKLRPHPGCAWWLWRLGHPLTPLEAILPMKARWKARNRASTGTVIKVA